MRNRIILHCVPPAAVIIPSAALTTLKTYLMQNGYVVDIIYWNLIFEDLQQESKDHVVYALSSETTW